MIAVDDTTFQYLHGREMAPRDALWDQALVDWRALFDNPDAQYDVELEIDCTSLGPRVTWGTTPQDVIAVDERVPDPSTTTDPARRAMMERAVAYIGLTRDRRSPAHRSMSPSSARAPMGVFRIWRPPPRWSAAARSHRA
jgi:homoaconitase/3-isopropylmalate dehydratase large subunit